MYSLTNLSRMQVLSLLLAALVALPATAGVATAATTTDLTVSITDDDTIEPGETTTVQVAVASADAGVGAAELAVALDDSDVAEITDVSVLNSPGSTDNAISAGGESADVKYAFANSDDTGEVAIVEVTVEALAEGSTSIDVVQNSQTGNLVVYDENGAGYTLDSVGSATLTVEAEQPPENQNPSAEFDVSPPDPETGETVIFDASDSNDADGSIESYEWDFDGDGTTDATGEQAENTFSSADDYDVTLTVTDDDGANDTATQTVSVSEPTSENQPPSADFTVDPAAPEVGETVTFDASGSTDDGSITSYAWDFADGETASGESVTHAFDAPGDYPVTLTVTDDDGGMDMVTQTVSVSEATEPEPGLSTAVSLSPSEDLVAVNGTTTFDVVVENTDGGVGAYDIALSVDDGETATIEDVSVDESALSDVQIDSDGSSATAEVALLDTEQNGSVTVATVTVSGAADGEAEIGLDVSSLGTEAGQAYNVTAENGATLTVSELVVGGSEQPAQDLDDDGVYEDVNGDGVVNELDVQLLFAERNSAVVQSSPDAFDFNGDGEFDILDVQALYYEEVA
ncbi:PKD domain-containing protein [Halobellus rarus]|uniref:PKD domain-containing protein n=1 Tax=Halobellus rarus TaxID=1126237 RepID=A0ABD6CRN5_9EURY|nr:PKD domain-containing protein [Halobellus rarus]